MRLPSGEIRGEFTLNVSSDWSMVGVFEARGVWAAAAMARASNAANRRERMEKLLGCWPKYTRCLHRIVMGTRGCISASPAHPTGAEGIRMSAENFKKGRNSVESTAQKAGRQKDLADSREHSLDKTIEDSFPASDPPSTDPNPDGDE
jgi:hypothetical protein